jgi:hypothetical protein
MDIDALIVELIESGRRATDDELSQIVAQAPFASRPVRISPRLRDKFAAVLGKPVARQLPSVEFHLLKRIHLEQQWPVGTTARQYVTDLHFAVRHPAARIWTFEYRTEPIVGFLAPSHIQNAPKPEAFVFVAYNARYRTITTDFQASGSGAIFGKEHQRLRQHR